MTPAERESQQLARADALLRHLEAIDHTQPRPVPDEDLWAEGDSDTRPWVDDPAADYVHDPWKGQP